MRLAAFGPLFAALLLILALAVPLPLGPGPAPAVPLTRGAAVPRCLALSYAQAPDAGELPTSVRLLAEASPVPGWYRAVGGPDPRQLYRDAGWRAAGPDSIDIAWHHSPVLRLPAAAGPAVGRVIPAAVAPLVAFVLEAREFRVTAARVPC